MLSFYIEVARTAFRRQLIYRWSNFAGLCTNIFFGVIFSSVVIALYAARPSVAGYDVRDTLRYTWLMQSLIMVVLPFRWVDLMQTIRSGDVVTDLSKPCDFYWYWFSREIGRSLYYLLFRGLPTYVAGALIFQLGIPLYWQAWSMLALVLPLAALLGVAYRYLYNIVAFWLIEARAITSFAVAAAQFFAGSYIPLPLLPGWLRAVVGWLPFQDIMDLPVETVLGKITGWSLYGEIARQVLWLVILTLLARALTRSARRHVIVQGG